MFPSLYHAHHNRNLEDLPFWLDLAGQTGGPILELGCGTGRVLKPLVEAGYRVTGLDHDLPMLKFLQKNPGLPGLSGTFLIAADISRFNLAAQFPLVILPCNTFSTLDDFQRKSCLQCITRQLSLRGIFAVSVPNPVMLNTLPARSKPRLEDEFIHPQTGNPIQVSSSWMRKKHAFQVTWIYDHLFPDGRVERLVTDIHHHLASFETYRGEVEQAGLVVKEVYGDYDRTSYDLDSPSLIITAAHSSH